LHDFTFESIESCRYLDNVCEEILRYNTPCEYLELNFTLILVNGVSRVATVADQINGVTIPKGTVIFVSFAAINFDDQIWGPDVDRFNPKRWEKLPTTVSNHKHLTFSQGRRSCISRKFAEIELKVLFIKLMQRLQFDEVKGAHIERRLRLTPSSKNGVILNITAVK
jgi:cytochrome P450